MAFEGDLSDLALGDIFQTLAMTRQSGTLVVKDREERRIAFSIKGISVLSRRDSLGLALGNYLVGVGALRQADLDKAIALQRRRREGFLGEFIREAGAVEDDAYAAAGRYLAQEELFDLFHWTKGKFEFEPGEPDLSGPFADYWFDVGGIAMEAARRMDETSRMQGRVDPSQVLLPVQGIEVEAAMASVTANDRHVYEALDGTKTNADLLENHFLGRFDVQKGLATLLELGFVRAASVEEIIDAAESSIGKKQYDRGARLFELASRLDPTRRDLQLQAAEAMVKAGSKREAAKQYALLGHTRLMEGDAAAAQDAFKRAVRLDSNSAAGHTGLMHVYFERGEIDDGLDSAQAAAKAWLMLDDHDSALKVASVGLDHGPGDVQLRLTAASAHLAADDQEKALEVLDDLTSILETTGENDKRLLDVYRQILHLDPARKDCQRRIEEIQAYADAKRKRMVKRVVAAVSVVLVALIAIPVISGPSIDGRLDDIDAMIVDGDLAGANEAISIVSMEPDISPDQQMRITTLRDKLSPKSTDEGPKTVLLPELTERLEARYEKAASQVESGLHTSALRTVIEGFDDIERSGAANESAQAKQRRAELKRESVKETHLLFAQSASGVAALASRFSGLRSLFAEEELRKADAKTMKDLVKQAEDVAKTMAEDDWSALEKTVLDVVARSGKPGDNAHLKITETAIRIVEDSAFIAEQGKKALAAVRKYELQDQFRQVRNDTVGLLAEGNVTEALERNRGFLALCEEFRAFEPAELYEAARRTYLINLDLDGKVEARVKALEGILDREREASAAYADGDHRLAWNLRAKLVQDFPNVNFAGRFMLPVHIESYPAGAEVYLIREGAPKNRLGVTPMVVNCTLSGISRFSLEMDGFYEYVVERRGAKDQRGGLESMDLVKIPLLVHEPETAHTSEAAAAGSASFLYLVGRDGTIRCLPRQQGARVRTFKTGLLDGMAAAPAAAEGRLFTAGLDGSGFVLDGESLKELAKFEFDGAVRAAGIPLGADAVFAGESGKVRRILPDGRSSWTTDVGKVRTDGAFAAGRLYYVNVDGRFVGLNATSGAIEVDVALNRHPRWQSPTIAGNEAFLGCDSREVVCVDLSGRKVRWSKRLASPVNGGVAVVGDAVVAVTTTGSVQVLAREDGASRRRILLGDRTAGGVLALADGFALVTGSGVVSRFDTQGDLVWRYDLQEPVQSPLALVEGEVVIVTRRGKVVVLAP